MIDEKTLHDRLLNDFDYTEDEIPETIVKINALNPEIYSAFESWFNSGKVQEIEAEGYTVASIREKYPKWNVIAAYFTLDFLKREPERAKAALNMVHIPYGNRR